MLYAAARSSHKVSLGARFIIHQPPNKSPQGLVKFPYGVFSIKPGIFLNEVDPVEVYENGIVNGASSWLVRGRPKISDIDPVKAGIQPRKACPLSARCSLSSPKSLTEENKANELVC